MKTLTEQDLYTRAKSIKLLLLDVDGVLSEGKIFFDSEGRELKAFNTLDGQGIKLLQKTGLKVGIITGRKSLIIDKRAQDLGITLMAQGREDKYDALQELLEQEAIEGRRYALEEIAFMGDDYPDLLVMCKAGLALTVPNAHKEVKEFAHWQSTAKGGEGAVREACDLLMKAQGHYTSTLNSFTQ